MWQVIGQDRILTLLERSLKEGSMAHAYLLLGPRHVGKGTLAVNLAQALNCDAPKPPCGQCHSCLQILAGKHADVISIGLDSKTEIGIDEIRELQHLANLPPYEGKCKVFIIDYAEYLSLEAANSLLKILEEPPPKVVWLLLASDDRPLLPTIVSRCQRLELKPMPLKQAEQTLGSFGVNPDRMKLLARLCRGRLGWALSALKESELLEQRSLRIAKLSSLLCASLEQRCAYALELATQFSQDRRRVVETMHDWLSWWRDLMLIKCDCVDATTNVDYEMDLGRQAGVLTLDEVRDFVLNLRRALEEISQNVNPRILFEWLMFNMPRRAIINDQDS